jgi:hypothetical protein
MLTFLSMVLLPQGHSMERPTRIGFDLANHDACRYLLGS